MKGKLLYVFAGLFSASMAFGQVGINTQNPQGIFNVDGSKNNAVTGTPTAAQQKDDFVIMPDGSVGVGTTQPHASALMEINVNERASGSKKGFLGPRVALKSNADVVTIPDPAVGLLVYNLATEPTFTVNGYVYWNGTEWIKFGTHTSIPGTVEILNCASATLSPKTYQSGMPYNGVMKVSYTGGNGGSYESGDPVLSTGVTGLTAVLQPGTLANGAGELTYIVTGTPSASSPSQASFTISLAGGTPCSASVGNGALAPGESQSFSGCAILASVANKLFSEYCEMPTIENTLRLDVYAAASSNARSVQSSIQPRIYNISGAQQKIWYSSLLGHQSGYVDGNVVLAPGGYQNLVNPYGLHLGYGINQIIGTASPSTGGGSNSITLEKFRLDLFWDEKWYIVETFFIVDNMNTTDNADNVRRWFMNITRMQ